MNAGKNDPVAHGSFTLERVFPQKPATVFGAFATAEGKARWFSGGADWKPLVREMDFRVGGHERAKGQWANGTVTDFLAHYHDIVQDRRIVYSYHMLINEEPISASLATLEFRAEGSGTPPNSAPGDGLPRDLRPLAMTTANASAQPVDILVAKPAGNDEQRARQRSRMG